MLHLSHECQLMEQVVRFSLNVGWIIFFPAPAEPTLDNYTLCKSPLHLMMRDTNEEEWEVHLFDLEWNYLSCCRRWDVAWLWSWEVSDTGDTGAEVIAVISDQYLPENLWMNLENVLSIRWWDLICCSCPPVQGWSQSEHEWRGHVGLVTRVSSIITDHSCLSPVS